MLMLLLLSVNWSFCVLLAETHYLKWTTDVARLHKEWLKFTSFWLGANVTVPRIVVSYDGLKVNQTYTLVQIMNFLGLKYSKEKLTCVTQMGAARSFKRSKSKGEKYYPYTLQHISHIRTAILAAGDLLKGHGIDYSSWLHHSNVLYKNAVSALWHKAKMSRLRHNANLSALHHNSNHGSRSSRHNKEIIDLKILS